MLTPIIGRFRRRNFPARYENGAGRALIGLAQIALVEGMGEDVVNFATAALELDPASAPAKALLASQAQGITA